MELNLDGRVALITGGASGIGLACVDAFVAEGARVTIIDRSSEGHGIAEAHRERGADVDFVQADLTDEGDVGRAVQRIVAARGQIDTVVGCAGVSGPVGARLEEIGAGDWDQVMAVNVRGNFLVTKHTLPHLQASSVGTVVYLASDSAFVAYEGMAAYSASKGAVVMLTKAVTADYPSIRANALCPGIVDTPMSRADMGHPEGFDGTGFPVIPARQIANHVLFLASPTSAPINGTTLVSDFGYLARPALGSLDFAALG
ncbi:SDR family NAD(P)-dependent oxidoreductase [Sinomonas atrocyanea]